MIAKLYQNIAAGLKQIKSCTVYQEDGSQISERPFFLISFYAQSSVRGINGRIKNTVQVDVTYFPEDEKSFNSECWEIGEKLNREFKIEEFKIKNRSLKISDRVLHFMFDVEYREYLNLTDVKMQQMSKKTDIKEE